jgi:Fe-S-cluster containining protein
VLVTFRDLYEIHQNFPQIDLADKISFYFADDDYINFKLLHQFYHPVKILNNENVIQVLFVGLKFHPVPQGKSTCAFYNVFKNECRIHSYKPMACRTYPFSLCKNDLSLYFDGRCLSVPELDFIQTKDRVTLLQNTALHRSDYKDEILKWNDFVPDNQKTISNFLKFVFQKREL